MKDNILNEFVNNLLCQELDEEILVQNIELFSKFLSYSNPNYKYNSTYLEQYICGFINLKNMLGKKNKLYQKIVFNLNRMNEPFEIIIDRSYFASYDLGKEASCYIGLDICKITTITVDVRVEFLVNNGECVFRKEYDNCENEELVQNICNDIMEYKKRQLRGTENETA